MSNNDNDYAGIDERYRPKNEGNNTNVNATKKEADKERVEKVGKFVIGGLLFWILLGVGIFAAILIFLFSTFNKAKKYGEGLFSDTADIVCTVASKVQTDSFNVPFENWSGTQYGSRIRESFDEIMQNNTKATGENGRIVTLVFNGKSMTDPAEMGESKKELNDRYKYEKYVEYDSEGYVNKVVIEELNNEEEKNFQQLFDDTKDSVLNDIEDTKNKQQEMLDNW